MSLLDNASLLLTPNAYKASKLYSVIPSNGNGDFTATRATTATRINSSGLVESVALNVPRVDYSLGGCPNILLEPQRTNLIQRSSEFDNATWVKLNATVTANAVISPSGIQDADRIQITNATSNYLDNASASLLTNGATYTVSVYARSFGATNQSFRIYGNGNKVSPILTATPNWQRFEYTFTAASTTVGCGIGSTSITDIVAWGYQLEAGAYATSFIPTTTASVTRNADSITRNNIFTNGLITASGGTWFVELRNNRNLTLSSEDVGAGLELGNSTGLSTNAFKFRRGGGTQRVGIWKVVGGTSTPLYSPSTDNSKIAIKWNGTTADVFENGVKVVSATSFTPTNMDFLRYIQNQFPTYLNEMALFPTPLTDAQCIALTQ